MRTRHLLALASVAALAGCDPSPRVKMINGAPDFIWVSQISEPVVTPKRLSPGHAAALPIGPGTGRAWRPIIAYRGCRYAYAAPDPATMPGEPGHYRGIGQWSFIQFGDDARLYVRERDARGPAAPAALSNRQPPAWPLDPTSKTCR